MLGLEEIKEDQLAKEDQHITLGENANITMEGIGRGEETRVDAEGDKGLRDLVGNEARLADAKEENGAGGVEEGGGES